MIDDKRNLKKFIFGNIDFKDVRNILDIGCGNCDDLKLIQVLYPHKNFELYGIDKLEDSNIKGITYLKHDLNTLIPLPDNTFDLIYSHNFFECILDKTTHLKELSRLLRKNGQVVYSHTDWDSQILDGDNKDLIRKVFRAYAEWKQPWMDNIDSWLGRRLRGIFNNSGVFTGDVKSYSIINTEFVEGRYSYNMINSFIDLVKEKLITRQEYDELLNNIKSYQQNNRFFYSITSFIYFGEKSN